MTKTHKDEGLVGTAVAAEMLDVDRSTLTRWANEGRIAPAFRNPGRTGSLVFRMEDVRRLQAELSVAS